MLEMFYIVHSNFKRNIFTLEMQYFYTINMARHKNQGEYICNLQRLYLIYFSNLELDGR
jgi:hypothetical protein